MRNLLIVLVCMFFFEGTYAQKSKEVTPTAVKSAFAAKYPTAQKVKWSIEKPGEFEAEFILNKVESSALYDATGKLLETETEIKKSDLPHAAQASLEKDFAGYKLDEIEKSSDVNGVITYEMEAIKGKEKLELSFDANGKLLSKEPLKKENEEEKN